MLDMSNTDDRLEQLLAAGIDAERCFQAVEIEADEGSVVPQQIESVRDAIDCLSCCTTVADAEANIREAIAAINAMPATVRREFRDVRSELADALLAR